MSHSVNTSSNKVYIWPLVAVLSRILKLLVIILAFISGCGIITMVLVTFLDVILRIFRCSLVGAFDIVQIAGVITTACALPYTTAVKGHVAIEYFFHKLTQTGRIVVDTFVRILGMGLFGFLSWQNICYGLSLKQSGQGTLTLQIPLFWIPYLIAFSCGVVVLVIFYNLLNPSKELIKS
jgi:TRAP-type C4-dicarboxylate transport system permease small subunit